MKRLDRLRHRPVGHASGAVGIHAPYPARSDLDCGGKRSATPLLLTSGQFWQPNSTEANEGNEGRDMKEFVREQDHRRKATSGVLSLCFLRGLLFGQVSI
jgi:hypothetical protein